MQAQSLAGRISIFARIEPLRMPEKDGLRALQLRAGGQIVGGAAGGLNLNLADGFEAPLVAKGSMRF